MDTPPFFLVVMAFKQVISSQLWNKMSVTAEWIYYFQEQSMREKMLFTGTVNIKGKWPSILNDFWNIILAYVMLEVYI